MASDRKGWYHPVDGAIRRRKISMEKDINVTDISRIDKKAFSISSLSDESDEKAYWFSKTPQERLIAMELLRQINYGYDPTTTRLQRILEIVDLTRS